MSGAEYDNAKQKTEIVGEWVSEEKGEGGPTTPDRGVSHGHCSKAWPWWAGGRHGARQGLPIDGSVF